LPFAILAAGCAFLAIGLVIAFFSGYAGIAFLVLLDGATVLGDTFLGSIGLAGIFLAGFFISFVFSGAGFFCCFSGFASGFAAGFALITRLMLFVDGNFIFKLEKWFLKV